MSVERWKLKVKPRAVAPPAHDARSTTVSAAVRLLLASFLLPRLALAAPPELGHLYPAGGQQGTNVAVTIGKTDNWPNIWVDSIGIKFTPTPLLGTYNVEIASDAPVGPHLVRAWNQDGASAPGFFIVSRERELRSIEPNDSPESPQVIETLPTTMNGRLDKNGDVDCYEVRLRKGETLVSWVEAFVLASTFDGLLRITDATGRVLAFNHDDRTLDPLLAWTAPADGTFVLQIMGFAYPPNASVQLTGGEGCVYRLHLTKGAVVRSTVPARLQVGTRASLRLIGWNLLTPTVEGDAGDVVSRCTGDNCPSPQAVFLQPPGISEIPELLEAKPDATKTRESLEVPSAITGCISAPGEVDRYSFSGSKGKVYEVSVTAAAIGSPLDAWLRIENADGKEIAKNDDAKGRDPQLTWTAPADGNFTISVGNVVHRGGEGYIYRLAVAEPTPAVAGAIASHSATITVGKTADLKVTIKRVNGFKSPLRLIAKYLPEGVSAQPAEVPEKDGEVTLQLTADTAAVPVGRPFTLALQEVESTVEHPVRYSIASTSENNGVPQGYTDLVIDSTEDLWITVQPAPAKSK